MTSWDYSTPSGTFVTPGDNYRGVDWGMARKLPCDHFGVGTLRIQPTRLIVGCMNRLRSVDGEEQVLYTFRHPCGNRYPPDPQLPLSPVVARIEAPDPLPARN